MRTEETTIPVAGNFRCCLASVAVEFLTKQVSVGEVSKCKSCGAEFVLNEDKVWLRQDD